MTRITGPTAALLRCDAFGAAPTSQAADQLVGAAIEVGINFVDTADVSGNMPVFDRPGAPAAAERERAEQILGCALRGRRVVHHRSRFSAGGGAHRFHRRGPRGADPGSRDLNRGVRFVSVLVVPASAAGARFRRIADGEPSCVGWRSSKAVGGARSRRRRRCERSNLGVRPTHPCIWVPLFGNRRSSFLEL
jgi:hypothetical protein